MSNFGHGFHEFSRHEGSDDAGKCSKDKIQGSNILMISRIDSTGKKLRDKIWEVWRGGFQ